jgi:hypothetical protein
VFNRVDLAAEIKATFANGRIIPTANERGVGDYRTAGQNQQWHPQPFPRSVEIQGDARPYGTTDLSAKINRSAFSE